MGQKSNIIWGKILSIGIVLAMVFSTTVIISGKASAEILTDSELSMPETPPIPPFTIYGIIYDENNMPVSDASVTITNQNTGESLKADVYDNGAYEDILEDLPSGYAVNDNIEITAVSGLTTTSNIIVVKQMGFGERVDIHFGDGKNDAGSNNILAATNTIQNNAGERTMLGDHETPSINTWPVKTSENPDPIIINPQITSLENEPVAEITLTDMRAPPYYRLAFTGRDNQLQLQLHNNNELPALVKVSLYAVEPDGINETFLKTTHPYLMRGNHDKTVNVFRPREDKWQPTQTGRNWIRGEIFVHELGRNWVLLNEFKESFSVVAGWKPIVELGPTKITEPTVWDNLTVIVNGDLINDAPLEIKNSYVVADDVFVNAPKTVSAGSVLDPNCTFDGQYKIQANGTGNLTVYGTVLNQDDNYHYWFYMNGTLNVNGGAGGINGTIENTHGSPDLSQPGGIICTNTNNVIIENGATVKNSKTHGIWLDNSDAVIRDSFVMDNGGDGIVCKDGSSAQIEMNNISWNKRHGISVDNSTPVIKDNNPVIKDDSAIQWNGVHGISVQNVVDMTAKIEGNLIDKNFGSGIYCDNANLTIANNTISSNGMGLIYRDDMENGSDRNNWTTTGIWHPVNNESGTAPPWNLSHSGEWSWWYGQNSTGNYDTGARTFGNLTSPTIDITNASSASLTFWSWYETDTPGKDTDQRWVIIHNDSAPDATIQLYGEEMRKWTRYIVNISAFVGMDITVTFYFDTNGTLDNNNQGWYIDDVELISAYPAIEGHGILLEGQTPSLLFNNTINGNNWYGIYCKNNYRTAINSNIISGNRLHGIYFYDVSNTTLSSNNCSYNDIVGICIEEGSSYNRIENNTCFYNGDSGIYCRDEPFDYVYSPNNNTISNNTCNYNAYCGIELTVADIITITNNTCNFNDVGIGCCGSNYTVISNNTCNNNTNGDACGIYLSGCANSSTFDNRCSGNEIGIRLDGHSNNTIFNNTCTWDNISGIYLENLYNDSFSYNDCSNSKYGFLSHILLETLSPRTSCRIISKAYISMVPKKSPSSTPPSPTPLHTTSTSTPTATPPPSTRPSTNQKFT